MKCTPRYFFSLLAVSASVSAFAQEPVYEAMPQRQVFVRVGYDLSRLALPYVRNNGSHGFEVSADGEIAYNFFPTVEIGRQSLKRSSDSLRYSMSGDYFRVGLDYNVINYKHRLDRDIFFLGVRLGTSRFSHEAPLAVVNGVLGTDECSIPKANLKATWGEAVVGLKGELVKNLYMGVTVRAKMMFSHTSYKTMTPYIIPGFGKGFYRFNAGLSYSILYAIPIRGAGSDGFPPAE